VVAAIHAECFIIVILLGPTASTFLLEPGSKQSMLILAHGSNMNIQSCCFGIDLKARLTGALRLLSTRRARASCAAREAVNTPQQCGDGSVPAILTGAIAS
jgi:hypothetical protein